MKSTLNLDFETYCDLDITKVGAYKYARHPSCEVLLGGYSINRRKVKLWDKTQRSAMPADLKKALLNPRVIIHAFNAPFERLILKYVLGIDLPLERFRCTMVHAYGLSFTGNLALVGEQVGIEKAKLTEGKELIKFFCQPRKPTRNRPELRNLPEHDPDRWEAFRGYCIRDVEAEMEIQAFLNDYPLLDSEWEAWFMDQRINDRGLPLDMPLIKKAIELAEIERSEVLGQIQKITKVDNPNSKPQVSTWLRANGCDIPNMQGDTISEYAERRYRKRSVKTVLTLLLRISKSSYTKYAKMLETSIDDRVYGTLQFGGASRTNRWAGRLIQPQNFIRPPRGYNPDKVIQQLMDGDISMDVMEHLAVTLRGAIAAPDKQLMTIADLAGIEGRVLPWLCRFQRKLDLIKAGIDMYLVAAAAIFHVLYDTLDEDSPERTTGKVAELALGFQGAVGALNQMASAYGLPPYEEDEAREIVKAWRRENAPIEAFWYAVDRAAKAAIREPNREFHVERLSFVVDGEFLMMRLPSGRDVTYHLPEINSEGQITYMGWNSYAHRWERIETYGGKLVENATQATARDILVSGMHAAEEHGFLLVGSVHDEILSCQEPLKEYDHEHLIECMTRIPPWAEGLPLGASGYTEKRYRK